MGVTIKRANDLSAEYTELYENGLTPGEWIGFESLAEYYSVKLGCTTYIGGIPSHGKSEFLFEILMNLSDYKGWKHLIFSPETGSAASIYSELAHKYMRKPFDKRFYSRMEINDAYKALAFLHEHFIVIEPDDKGCTVDDIYKIAAEIKKENFINTVTIDPWNELNHDFGSYGGREDKYLENKLGKIRRMSRDLNIHSFIIAHPKGQRPNQQGFYDMPTAYDLSGGGAWYAKAESIIAVWRPPFENGNGREKNEVVIEIQKAKPKEIGKKGSATLFFDLEKSRYYEKIQGGIQYAGAKGSLQKPIKPNVSFYEKLEEDGLPF
jgi:twinkle protein